MAYRGEHYKGSIVHNFGGFDKPEICANCIRWSKRDGCAVKKRYSPAGRCNVFQFAKYANYRLDGRGGVEYNDEYLAYLEKKRAKKPEVHVSYIEELEELDFDVANDNEADCDEVVADEFEVLEDAGVEYIDKRPVGGALWVVGGRELADLVQGLSDFGLSFHFAKGGGRATGKRPGWWSK